MFNILNAGIVSFILFAPCYSYSSTLKATFVNPSTPDNPFWSYVGEFMEEVANDLDIELKVIYGDNNWLSTRKKVVEHIHSEQKPDYILSMIQGRTTANILKACTMAGVKVFIFNTDVIGNQRELMGYPRGMHPSWIGHMYPNDEMAGYQLADTLIRAAISKSLLDQNNKLHIVGITGSSDSSAALERNKGFQQAANKYPEAILHRVIPTDWSQEKAYKRALDLLELYPETSVIWSASDHMSLSIIKAIKQKNRIPGKNMLTGGVDWLREAIDAVNDGVMTATAGGHFMEGGWALVLLYDYHHGQDFLSELGSTFKSPMHIIDKSNVSQYLKHLSDTQWDKVDFRKFSKVQNPDLKNYDFSLKALLNQFNE